MDKLCLETLRLVSQQWQLVLLHYCNKAVGPWEPIAQWWQDFPDLKNSWKTKRKQFCRWRWWCWKFRTRQGSKLDSGNRSAGAGVLEATGLRLFRHDLAKQQNSNQGHRMWNEKAIQNKRRMSTRNKKRKTLPLSQLLLWAHHVSIMLYLPHQPDKRLHRDAWEWLTVNTWYTYLTYY